MSRAAANGEFVSPFASHEEAVEASAALAKLPLPDSSDDESDGEAGASSGASGAASAQGGGSQRQVQNPSIAARAPGPVPDHVYALMNVTGSDGCCSTSGQGLDLAAQTYLTAEAAAADAVSAFQPKKTDDDDEEEARFQLEKWSPPYESDYRRNPKPGSLLSKPYGVEVLLLEFSLAASISLSLFRWMVLRAYTLNNVYSATPASLPSSTATRS